MRRRLLTAISGVIVVGIVLAGLLGVIDALAKTNPIATKAGPSSTGGNSGDNNGIGNLSGAVIPDLSLDISPQGGLPPHIPLFDIIGSKTSLLRSSAAPIYDGNTWNFDPNTQKVPYNGETLSPPVKDYSQKLTNNIKVTPLEKFSSGEVSLPTALYPVSMSASVPLNYVPEDQLFISEQGMPDSYSFQSTQYAFDKATLDNAQVDPQPEYLQIPSSTPDNIQQLAKDITRNISSPYEKAMAIENYLKNNYTYAFDYKPAPEGTDPNEWFLFNEKKGVCSNFNSAFVALARSAGIPSRLVSGYAIDPETGEQTVYADQAHTWAEVKFKDLGWIPFDATGNPPQPLTTKTAVTSVNTTVQKGQNFNVIGTVQAQGVTVNGVMVEIYINTSKSHEDGTLIGKGIVSGGTFNIQATIPSDVKVGNYQLLAHSFDSPEFQQSWSDPQIKVISATAINLNVTPQVKLLEPVVIHGTLTEDSGQPLAGQNVNVLLNGRIVSQLTTDKTGQFQLKQSLGHSGEYTLKADFNGTTYYLPASQEASFQVLIPTVINLQAPETAKTGNAVLIEGSLVEEKTLAAVPGQQIELLINGNPVNNKATTDENGQFKIEHTFSKSGIYQIEARFSSVPYYWESQNEAILQVISTGGGIFWVYPVVIAVVVIVLVGGFWWYRWRKQNPSEAVPVIAGEKAETKEVLSVEESTLRDNRTKLSIEFPGIKPPLPDVWGKNDELGVVCRLTNADGVPMAAKTVQVILAKPIASVNTDDSGVARLGLTFPEQGQYKLVAKYIGESGIGEVSCTRKIRIVDYREEIVELYKTWQNWLREIGIALAEEATSRETEQIIARSGKGLPEEPVHQVSTCFEEADFSLHPVGREEYIAMYLAQHKMRGYGN